MQTLSPKLILRHFETSFRYISWIIALHSILIHHLSEPICYRSFSVGSMHPLPPSSMALVWLNPHLSTPCLSNQKHTLFWFADSTYIVELLKHNFKFTKALLAQLAIEICVTVCVQFLYLFWFFETAICIYLRGIFSFHLFQANVDFRGIRRGSRFTWFGPLYLKIHPEIV